MFKFEWHMKPKGSKTAAAFLHIDASQNVNIADRTGSDQGGMKNVCTQETACCLQDGGG